MTTRSDRLRWPSRLGWMGVGALLAAALLGRPTNHAAVLECWMEPLLSRARWSWATAATKRSEICQEYIRPAWIMTDAEPQTAEQPDAPLQPAPEVSLPRMPGDNLLREDVAWDEASRAWVITQSLNVPARIAIVERFYRMALASQTFETHGGALPDEEGALRTILKGRAPHRHVQVSLRQPSGTLVTRVRVIWKLW